MFGILYGLFMFVSSGYEGLRRHKLNNEGKQRGYERLYKNQNPYNIYFDWQGREHDLSTGEPVQFYHKRGHYYRKGIYSNEIRDITQENFENHVRYESKQLGGKIVLPEYDRHQLWSMWQDKNREFPDYMKEKMPMSEDVLWNDMIIYRHCYTNRLCFKYYLGNAKFKNIKSSWDNIIYQYVRDNKPVFPFAFVDLFTNDILDVVNNSENEKGRFGYKVTIKNGGKIITHTEWLSQDITDNIIHEYNEGIHKGLYPKIISKWKKVFM